MTSPNVVDAVAVEILADVRRFAKQMRKDVTDAIKGLDLDKLIQDQVGKKPIKVPLDADDTTIPEKVRKTRVPKVKVPLDADTSSIPEKVKKTRVPKVEVPVDPLMAAFQQQLRRTIASLSRQVEVNVPVTAEGGRLRAQLGAQLAAIQAQSRITVPTEPGDKAAYEAKLRAQLALVAAKVKQTVKVDVDVDSKSADGPGGIGGGVLGGIGKALKGLSSSLPIVGNLTSALSKLFVSLQNVSGSSAQLGGSIAGAFATAGGPIFQVVAAILAAVAAFAALTTAVALAVPVMGAISAAILSAAGAAAALPGALAGIGAAVGTLALGFRGISEAFKPKAGGGGGAGAAVNQARQIAAASRGVESAKRGIEAANRSLAASERGLAAAQRGVLSAQRAYQESLRQVDQAQKQAVKSQEAVSRARREAKEDIEDLGRALRGAVISEAEATQSVADAQLALSEAKLTGDLAEIKRAQNAYDRAVLSLEEATDSTADLTEESAESAKKGVEGSDKVQDALEDQAQAYDAVRQAQNGVLDAQNGLIDAADGLKSAQDGVLSAQDGIKSATDGLISAQDSLAQAQQKVASGAGGVAKEVIKLAPAAQKFVDAVKGLKPAFEDLRLDVQQRLFQGLDKTVTNLGKAWIPRLKETLGSYADTFNGFFKNLGTAITTPKFMTDLQIAAEGFRTGMEKVGTAVTSKLVPAFGTLAKASAPFLEKLGGVLADVITKFSDWIEKAEKSGKLRTFFEKTADAMSSIATTGKEAGRLIGNIVGILLGGNGKNDKSAVDSFNDGLRKLNDWLAKPENRKKIEQFVDKVKGIFTSFRETYEKAKPFIDKLFGSGDDKGATSGASSLGTEIGKALIAGIVSGFFTGLNIQLALLYNAFLGPNSLIGKMNEWLGIASPSTVTAEMGRFLVEGLIGGIGERLGVLFDKARQIKDRVFEALSGAGSWLVGTGKAAVSGAINGIGSMFGNLRTRAVGVKNTVLTALANAGSWLLQTGKNAVIGLGNGVVSLYGNLRSRVAGLRTTAINAVSGAGKWLESTGKNVVIGLYNGIVSMGQWLYNKLISFAKAVIPAPIAKALGINSPSKVAFGLGQEVGTGLAGGVLDRGQQVVAAAEEIARLAVPQVADATLGLGADMDARISGSLQVAEQRKLEIAWKNGANADPVIRAFQDLISIRYNNNPVAAFSK